MRSRVRLLQGLAFSINGSEDLMRRARALVGHFNSSSQASESLAAVQTRGTNTKPRKVINDCPTRWWSTWKFVKRLRELKVYFGLLVVEGVIDEELNMSDAEWAMLEDVEELLEPFMQVQQLLEGQKYVTLPFAPYLISLIRKKLEEKCENARSHTVKALAQEMLTHKIKGLNTYWGKGEDNTIYDENEVPGRGNRQKGFPRTTLLAAALDPRSKSLKYIGLLDRMKIWCEIKVMMRRVSEELRSEKAKVSSLVEIVAPTEGISKPLAALFEGIGDDDSESVVDDGESTFNLDAELDNYKSMKSLSIFLPGDIVSDPLAWWQIHEKTLPVLSILARRLLCIPATSAPSERVFSVAGLTISKCRTSILPQNASDLIFLHDSWQLAEECEKEFNGE